MNGVQAHPPVPGGASAPTARAPRRSPLVGWAVLVAVAVLALALEFGTWFVLQRGTPRPAPPSAVQLIAPPGAAPLAQLVATPKDMAEKGAAATTVLPADSARARNASVPFSSDPLTPARPFGFTGSDQDFARARDCLAAAALYEAGLGEKDQAAVMQVVLNRVRHPAFPATVCGVVYQGSERSTGCQFTFTCDGALRRILPERWWDIARTRAAAALKGRIDPDVGLATHYHTDWVYPYWSPSLRKLSAVGTHLFFTWTGGWGSRAAFARRYGGAEPAIGNDGRVVDPSQAIAATAASDAAAPVPATPDGSAPQPATYPDAPLPAGLSASALYGTRLRFAHPDGGAFGLLADPRTNAQQLIGVTLKLCPPAGAFCRVSAWGEEADVPHGLMLSAAARRRMIFDYVRDPRAGTDRLQFDCGRFRRPNRAECLPTD